jgi:ubiquinone/menaquinone biosynthesis C-methylase UbiE
MHGAESFRSRSLSVAEAWQLWFDSFRAQTRAASDLLLAKLRVRPGMSVLDLGSGAGEPAFALARAVGETGKVVASDLAGEAMTALAQRARELGLRQLEACQADMHSLPFAEATFDAVSSRLSLMFCPKPEQALSEVRRVLKPQAAACFLVWGTPTQPLFAGTLGEIEKRAPLPIPALGKPGPFQFAEPGVLGEALSRAGFRQVVEQTLSLAWPWPGPPEQMWLAFSDLSGPVLRETFATLPEADQDELERQIIANLAAFYDGKVTDPGAVVVVARGFR